MKKFLVNRTILILMISDILVLTGFGLVTPIIAIFIKEDLQGGTIFAAGIATAIFWIVKSVVQLPLAKYVDEHSHKVAKNLLIFGTALITFTPFIYILAQDVYWMYIAEFIYAIGAGFAYPSWLGIWSTHLDKNKESFEWTLYSTLVGLGTAFSGAFGATMAELLGFRAAFALVAMMSFIGCVLLSDLERRGEHIKPVEVPLEEKVKIPY